MSNPQDYLQVNGAAAGVTDSTQATDNFDELMQDAKAKAASGAVYDLEKELNDLKLATDPAEPLLPSAPTHPAEPEVQPATAAEPVIDELDMLEPKPVLLTPQKQAELRQQAIKYKELSDELEKNFYEQEEYFLISVRWLKRWKVYVSYDEAVLGKPSSKYIGAGTLPPVNADILDSKADFTFEFGGQFQYLDNALRPGLKEHEDYAIISKDMWGIFVGGYQHYNFQRFMAETTDGKKVQAVALYNQILQDIQREYLSKFSKIRLQLPKYKPLNFDLMEVLSRKVRGSIKKRAASSWSYNQFSKDNIKMWAVEDELTERQFMNHLTKCCRANSSYSYKIFFPGEFLDVSETSIEKLQLQPDTIIVFEIKQERDQWTFYNKKELPYAKCDECRNVKKLSVFCSCNNAVYCSKECKSRDKYSHKRKCDRDAESSEDEKVLAMTEKSRKGIVGLRNIGNTCFMNSGIQCLSSVDALTQYFLANAYINDINLKNPIGTKGELSKAYAKLLENMWYGQESSITPNVLKRAIGKFQPMFVGYEQHDSGELVSYLLDGLHEDLNRVKDKPYTQTKDYDGRPDHIIAKENWETFLLRNQSIIVDLMYGQYKSRLECPKCAKVSVTFDPFLMVPLPVPQDDSKIFELVYLKQDQISTVKIQIPYKKVDNLKLSDIASKISNILKVSSNMVIVGMSYYESKLLSLKLDANEVRKQYKHKTVLFRQKLPEQNLQTGVEVSIQHTLCNSLYGNQNYRRSIIKPRIFQLDPSTTAKQIHDLFYKYWGFMLGVENYEKDVLNAEKEDQKWRVLLVTKSSYEFCQFCEKISCYNCPLPYTDDLTVKDLLAKCDKFKQKHRLEFEIYWRKGADEVEKKFETSQTVASKPKGSDDKHTPSANPTIYDCLKLAEQPQTLGEDNAWYCPSCKEFVLATKQMTIYKAPKILILSFKRFKNKGYFKSKLTTVIDFPINDFDISDFVLNHDLPEDYFKQAVDGAKPSTHYSLFAISNHMGSLGGGHYTAYCRKNDSRWYEFDDSSVTPVSQDRLVDAASYILFYKKKE